MSFTSTCKYSRKEKKCDLNPATSSSGVSLVSGWTVCAEWAIPLCSFSKCKTVFFFIPHVIWTSPVLHIRVWLMQSSCWPRAWYFQAIAIWLNCNFKALHRVLCQRKHQSILFLSWMSQMLTQCRWNSDKSNLHRSGYKNALTTLKVFWIKKGGGYKSVIRRKRESKNDCTALR